VAALIAKNELYDASHSRAIGTDDAIGDTRVKDATKGASGNRFFDRLDAVSTPIT